MHVRTEPFERSLGGEVEFLEGLDIRDPEFEHWLRDQRLAYSDRSNSSAIVAVGEQNKQPQAYPVVCLTPEKPLGLVRPTIGLVADYVPGGEAGEDATTDFVLDLVARSVLGYAVADVMDFRTHRNSGFQTLPSAGPDWLMQAVSSVRNGRARVTLSLSDVGERRLLWTDAEVFDLAEIYQPEQLALGALVNRAVYVTLDQIARNRDERHESARLALGAIHQLSRLGNTDLDEAERMLLEAYALEKRSAYLGWLLHVATTRYGERRLARDPGFDERVRELMIAASDNDAFNPLTLAFMAQAHSYIFGEYDYALELADRAVIADPMSPIAWDIRALTHGYLGEIERGRADAMRARALGGAPPYRSSSIRPAAFWRR